MATAKFTLSDGTTVDVPFNLPTINVSPTPTSKVNFGYSAQPGELTKIKGLGFKDPKVIRVFESDATLSTAASTFSTAYATWLSWKPSQISTATWGTQVDTYVRSTVPKNVRVLFSAHHEPENNAGSGQTLTQWAAAWRAGATNITAACAKLRSEGWDVWSAPIICDWVFEGWSGQSIGLWYPTDGSIKVDYLGFDSYPQGQNAAGKKNIARLRMDADFKPSLYADPSVFDCYKSFRRTADYATKFGKPWAIGELGLVRGDLSGADVQYKYSLQNRADWHEIAGKDMKSLTNPPTYVTWYMDGGCYVDDPAGISAINKSLV